MKDIILLPTYNERENIKLIIPEIFSAHPDIQVLVIDDNSPDKTADVVRELQKNYPGLELLLRKEKAGLGAAYTHAFAHVLTRNDIDHVITMDADGSHPVEYLKDMLAKGKDVDLVVGSRYTEGGGIENWEMWRMLLSRYGNLYARTLTGIPLQDLTAGFLCFRAKTLRRVPMDRIAASGYAFLMDLKFHSYYTAHATVAEVPILFKCRREGESKISHHIIGEGVRTPLRLLGQRIWNT